MERMVRTSAKALVIRDGRMLAIKMQDQDGVFYIMPGGGQIAGELLPATAEREVAEETGIAVKAKDAVFIIEGEKGLFIAMPSKKSVDGEYRLPV